MATEDGDGRWLLEARAVASGTMADERRRTAAAREGSGSAGGGLGGFGFKITNYV